MFTQRSLPTRPKVSVQDIDGAPANLPARTNPDYEADYKALFPKFIEVAEENFRLQQEMVELQRSVATQKRLDDLIEPYAAKAYWFMKAYSGTVGALLIASGSGLFGFSLPESVLGYLVGSTAVTVVGLVGMVLTGIFVRSGKK